MENMAFLPRKGVEILRLIPSGNKLEIVQGQGQVLNYQSPSSLSYTYTFLASTPALVLFHSFYFPGWEVMVDKQTAPLITNPLSALLPLPSLLASISLKLISRIPPSTLSSSAFP